MTTKPRIATLILLGMAAAACESNAPGEEDTGPVLTTVQQEALGRINTNMETLRQITDLCEIGYIDAHMIWCDEILQNAPALAGGGSAEETANAAVEYCQHTLPVTVLNTCFDRTEASLTGPVDPTSMEPTRCDEASHMFDRIPSALSEAADVVAVHDRFRDVCHIRLRVAQLNTLLSATPPGCLQAEYLLNEVVASEVLDDPQIVESRNRHSTVCAAPTPTPETPPVTPP